MKPFKIIFLLSIVALVASPILLIADAEAAPSDADYVLIGQSTTGNGGLILGITDKATVAYPSITWTLWIKADTHVSHTAPDGTIVLDEVLSAGLYEYSYTLPADSGKVGFIWEIGDKTVTYNVTIAANSTAAWDYEKVLDTITVEKSFLTQEERETAIGCILCALVPSLFIIPYWRRRIDEDYYTAF